MTNLCIQHRVDIDNLLHQFVINGFVIPLNPILNQRILRINVRYIRSNMIDLSIGHLILVESVLIDTQVNDVVPLP